ncbi:MAG: ABC transporter ATP-binding protein, partial [Pseudomonadota bacterium]|nr:ABC transporter ATP-binding protein [Pseudomonadota bacterium]
MSESGTEHESHLTATAIRVRGLSKCYQVYARPEDRLKQALMPRMQRLLRAPQKAYHRDFWALRDVSFDVRKGETLGVIGRNGSGKSTLLQIICGTLTPTAGSVEVNGRVAALLELGSGFNPEFTGRENIYMSGAVLGLTRRQIDAKYADIVAFADIGDFVSQPVKTYSSGMFVRLAFAVIAHADADILVIDEALSVGDVFFGQKCMRFLRKFQETGTVLFVSHDAAAVVNLCDSAILLDHGHLTMNGTAKEVSEAYHASAAYSLTVHNEDNPCDDADDDVDDPRDALISRSSLRNDIQVFRFDPSHSGFGDGSARITSARLTTVGGRPLSWVIGGEIVQLDVRALISADLHSPIVGFFLKDRLGQHLIGDNSYLTYVDAPVPLVAGQSLEASFEFRMPLL